MEPLFLIFTNFLLLLLALSCLWVLSVRIKDASIIDIFWGPACAFGAVLTYFRMEGSSPRDLLLTVLACLWAFRLAAYLAKRNLGHGEDLRYQKMRAAQVDDKAFERWSFTRVYMLQGVIAWFISLPVQLGQLGPDAPLGLLSFIGILIFSIGLAFETIGDWQLTKFKANPDNKGKLMTRGLWSWTRHPNYFGDATVWFGLTLIALSAPIGWLTILSPVVMAYFLVNISGKSLTERHMRKKYPEWATYAATTSGFFPMPPKSAVG